MIHLGGGGVQRDVELLARPVTGVGDGLENDFDGLFGGLEVRSEPALVADSGREALALENLGEVVIDFSAHSQRVCPAARAVGHDHELLNVHGVVRVLAAVEDVHHRNRQVLGVGSAEVAIERQSERLRRCLRAGKAHAQNRVRAELAFVRGAVEVDHRAVDRGLLGDRAS